MKSFVHLRWAVSVLLLAVIQCFGVPKTEKLPIPGAEDQETTVKLVQDIYQKEFASARDSAQKEALAEALLRDALDTKDDATGRYVLLEMARELAVDVGDIDTAIRAIDQSTLEYDTDGLAIKAEALSALSDALRTREQHNSFVAVVNPLITDAIVANRYDLAKQFSEIALVSARKLRDIAIVRQAASQVNDVEKLEKEYSAVADALTQLDQSPADPKANLAAGRFYCFVKGDWETGIPMLALGDDQALKELAEKELADPAKPDEQVSLGDEWWSLSDSHEGRIKRNLSIRAQHWYTQALPQLSGLTQARVRKRLEESEQPTPRAVNLPAGTVVAFEFEEPLKRNKGKKVVRDISNNGGDAEITKGGLVRGVRGSAVSFDPSGFAKFSDKALPKGDLPRTILCWVRLNKIGDNQVPFAYGGNNEGDATYLLLRPDGDVTGRGNKMNVGNPGGRNEQCGSSTITHGNWHHVGLVYDGNGTAQLFVDGQQDLSFSRRYQTTLPGYAFLGIFVAGPPSINGAVDDFIILDRVVSVDEIRAIKDGGLRAARSK